MIVCYIASNKVSDGRMTRALRYVKVKTEQVHDYQLSNVKRIIHARAVKATKRKGV